MIIKQTYVEVINKRNDGEKHFSDSYIKNLINNIFLLKFLGRTSATRHIITTILYVHITKKAFIILFEKEKLINIYWYT